MDWKLAPQHSFKKIKKDLFILKIINTQCLITEPSNSVIFDKKIQLNIHHLQTSKDIVVGYEIQTLQSSPLVLIFKDYLLLGSSHLKKCTFKSVFKDKFLEVLKTKNDFLFYYLGQI